MTDNPSSPAICGCGQMIHYITVEFEEHHFSYWIHEDGKVVCGIEWAHHNDKLPLEDNAILSVRTAKPQ